MIIPNNAKNVGDKWVERFRIFYVNGKKYSGRYVSKRLLPGVEYNLLGNRYFRGDEGGVASQSDYSEHDNNGVVTRGLRLSFGYNFKLDEFANVQCYFVGWELDEVE